MEKPKLIQRFAERFSVDPNKLFDTLKATAFKQRDGSAPTNEQMMALLVVADQYG
ncbi:phage recombination protein Bet, partial [Vibrio sp. 1562]|nr:phage recombination protein Bet [Vibrio sp. 1074]MDW2287861.1 phage recombination protein Bet [Vibrio sp. 1562]